MIFEIDVPNKYDMLSSIHSWIYPDIQPVPEQTAESIFFRLYQFNNELVPIALRQSAIGCPILVEYSSDSIEENEIEKKIIQALGFNVNLNRALIRIRNDEKLEKIYPGVAGIHPYQSPSVFEALIKTIIQQQVSYRSANVLTKKMVLAIGPMMFFDNLTFYGFPTPEEISKCNLQQLGSFGFGYKAKHVHEIAISTTKRNLDLEDLRGKQQSEVESILQPIHGIGRWTVDTLAISGLGNYAIFPYDDLGVRNILGRLYNNGDRMSVKEVEAQAARWGEDSSLVLYLIMCADVLGLFGKEGRQQTHKRKTHR